MLLIDASNLFYGAAQEYFMNTRERMDMESVRFVLTSRLAAVCRDMRKFGKNRVLAFDDRKYWRRQVFPHYKASRAKERSDSRFDWDKFFEFYSIYKEELAEFFPLKSLQVDYAEADDIIAVLAPRFSPVEDVCIWSSDTDDLQLQNLDPKIKQYSYKSKKMITPANSDYNLFEHVVRGDATDGIPNILSASDHFVQPDKKRQKAVKATDVESWQRHASEPEKFCSDAMLRRFRENQVLIDYRYIPDRVSRAIIDAYENTPVPQGKIFDYMVRNKMIRVMQEGGL